MIYGELGRYPLFIVIKSRMIKYWASMTSGENSKYSSIMCNLLAHERDLLPWFTKVKSILDDTGLSYIWNQLPSSRPPPDMLSNQVTQILQDQFVQTWRAQIDESEKAMNYKIFKQNFKQEKYFSLLPTSSIIQFMKFRTCNHKLAIETGRYNNTPRRDRRCNLCNSDTLGDEYHFLFECRILQNVRKKFLKQQYQQSPNTLKFEQLMQSTDYNELVNLIKFIKQGMALIK